MGHNLPWKEDVEDGKYQLTVVKYNMNRQCFFRCKHERKLCNIVPVSSVQAGTDVYQVYQYNSRTAGMGGRGNLLLRARDALFVMNFTTDKRGKGIEIIHWKFFYYG